MKYQALAIDLDGTLLIGDTLPPGHRQAIRDAADAGYKIIIATARWRQMAEGIASEIGISAPIIACSGAQVYIPNEKRDIFDHRLPQEFVDELFPLCDANRCIVTITTNTNTYLVLDGEPDPTQMPEEMKWMPKLVDSGKSLPRIATVQGSSVVSMIKSELKEKYSDTVNIYDSIGPSGKLVLTMTAKAANKGHALLATCQHMGIDPAEVIAFGDAENDISMFEVAGASVAMGQAEENIKSAATIVTSANTEDGVAKIVNKLLVSGDL
ncbi:MAG: HAD family hydrolase [Pseudomonadales bacterium]|jgi:Cof subfamily protein (haloacid dehalogenase superfamily)